MLADQDSTFTGQGVNTSFEDVAVLARHLQDGGLCEESLRSFEKERIPRVSAIAIQEQVSMVTVLIQCCEPHSSCALSSEHLLVTCGVGGAICQMPRHPEHLRCQAAAISLTCCLFCCRAVLGHTRSFWHLKLCQKQVLAVSFYELSCL